MTLAQPGLLAPAPPQARYLFWSLTQPTRCADALKALARHSNGQDTVALLGVPLIDALNASRPQSKPLNVPGLRNMPDFSAALVNVPAVPQALCLWLRGSDLGDLLTLTRQWQTLLAPAFELTHTVDAFVHRLGTNGHGHDLTGYEDGTENPQGQDAITAAVLQGAGDGLDGSSFVAVQQWRHNFTAFDGLSPRQQDLAIGRQRVDNEEIDDAPPSAHVKRTAQESFAPEAFVLRRSMPWVQGREAGLMFVACGRSFDAFEAQMRRMSGMDDGVTDALFQFTQPISGSYFWAPPMRAGGLDLRQIGL